MKRSIEILTVSGQAAASSTGTTVFQLPGGYRYYQASLVGTIAAAGSPASMTAGCGDVKLKFGGRVQRLMDVTEINDFNTVMNPPGNTIGTVAVAAFSKVNDQQQGTNASNWILPIYFAEPWRETYGAIERFAYDLLPGEDSTLEVDFKSVTAAPTLALRAVVEPLSDVLNRPFNNKLNRTGGSADRPLLSKWYRTTRNVGGSSLDIPDLPKSDLYQHIRIYDPTTG